MKLLISDKDTFEVEIAKLIIDKYKNYYKELEDNKDIVLNELTKEKEKFTKTLEKVLKEFEKVSTKDIDGQTAFHLFDTYGFPLELTVELANEKGLKVDIQGYNDKFKEHQNLSRTASQGKF